jgi:predicted amidohydrolase YtcJ
VADEVMRRGAGDEWLRLAGVKGFVDGSLGSMTAFFSDPYQADPGNRGLRVTDPSDLARCVRGADAAGLQVAVHAIGDEANRELLDLFQAVTEETGSRRRRFRIEHAQHLHPADTARFADLDVIASVQPYHAIDDGRWAESVIGHQRAARMHVFRSLADSGARLAFGSDWTVAPLDPLSGIYAAVTRRTLDGQHPDGWFPDEAVSIDQALRAYTSGAAFAGCREDDIGTIEPDKRADLVMLSDDLFAIEPERIRDARVEMTMTEGRVVFSAA